MVKDECVTSHPGQRCGYTQHEWQHDVILLCKVELWSDSLTLPLNQLMVSSPFYYQGFCDSLISNWDKEMASVSTVEFATCGIQTVHNPFCKCQACVCVLLNPTLSRARGSFGFTESHTICIIYHVMFFFLSLFVKLQCRNTPCAFKSRSFVIVGGWVVIVWRYKETNKKPSVFEAPLCYHRYLGTIWRGWKLFP